MTTPQKVVAVTGSSGHLGAKLMEHLEDAPWLAKLMAFDLLPLRAPVHNIAAFRKDVSLPISEELIRHRASAVVHLAFEWRSGMRRREADARSERNRAMARQVIKSCQEAEVGHLIYVSSHSVYGASAEASVSISEEPLVSAIRDALAPAIDEEAPVEISAEELIAIIEGVPVAAAEKVPAASIEEWRRELGRSYAYAKDNLNAEIALLELAKKSPEIKVTILRSCLALGPMTSTALLREMYFPPWSALSGRNLPLQFVNDDDLARILCLVIANGLPGVFNVAAPGVVFRRELARDLETGKVMPPASIGDSLKRLTGGTFAAHTHNLDRWPIIMSSGNLQQAAGYRYRHTALDSVAALVNYHEEFQENLPKLEEVRLDSA